MISLMSIPLHYTGLSGTRRFGWLYGEPHTSLRKDIKRELSPIAFTNLSSPVAKISFLDTFISNQRRRWAVIDHFAVFQHITINARFKC